MRFDCPRRELAEAVSMALPAASSRTTLPILQTLKVEATDGQVRIVGSDRELWIERTFACMVHETGATCINARILADIVNALPDGDLSFETVDATIAKIIEGGSEYTLQTMDSFDFVDVPALPSETELALPMKELRRAIDSVLIAVSSDVHRQVLTGVQFAVSETGLRLVSTDTHRLAVRTLKIDAPKFTLNAVAPEKALKAIKLLPVGDDDKLSLFFGNGQIGASANGARVVSQLLQGAFPNWERVVPKESSRVWTVEVDQLSDKVKRALIIARDNSNRIKFAGHDSQLLLSARSDERGEAKEEVNAILENGQISIAFNGKYVQDVLDVIDSEGVKVELTEATTPAIFRPAENGEDYFCVIMPMQLESVGR